MTNTMHSAALIAVIAIVSAAIKFLPFLVFSKGVPKSVLYLGKVLPCAIMGMLIVYCLKGVSFVKSPYGIPEAIAIAVVVVLHKWKKNTLLSIFGGVALYMFLVQAVF